jgi:hypothetical protein
MRKHLPASRRLVTQPFAKLVFVDSGDNEAIDTGEMQTESFGELCAGGEVDVTVGEIDRETAQNSLGLGDLPKGFRTDFVDCRHRTLTPRGPYRRHRAAASNGEESGFRDSLRGGRGCHFCVE